MKITVLGAGAWGSALSRLLQHANHDVTLWGYDQQALEDIRGYLDGRPLRVLTTLA